MDVETCIEGRRSIRAFKPDALDDSIVNEALRMANLAPSAGNLQARDFVVVKDADTKNALAEAAYDQDFVRTAPVVIVFCANLQRIGHYGERGRTLYCIQDTAAAIENMMLYLHGKGIGSVWVGAFDEAKTRRALHLPNEARPVAMVPIGYPAEKGGRTGRLPMDRIVHKEKW
jgi:nitroreductase